MKTIKIATCLLYLIAAVHSAKILGVMPYPSKSHIILADALLKELATRGHEVTMITGVPADKTHKNFKDIYIDKVRLFISDFMSDKNASIIDKIYKVKEGFTLFTEAILDNKEVQEVLERKDFDLVIQMPMLSDALLGIGYKLQVPTIVFSVSGSNAVLNYYTSNPTPYSYIPHFFVTNTDNMNFLQRTTNTLAHVTTTLFYHFVVIPFQNNLLHKYFPDAPHVTDLINEVDLFLLNSHTATESVKPHLPNLIQIGGFHLEEKEILPNDLQEYLDKSKNGVIYFSLGSNVKSSDLSQTTINNFISAFEKIKMNVLWKFEGELPRPVKNIKTQKWLPQRAVLAHENIKIFITHSGLGGTVEAIYNAVPMICMPFGADQYANCQDSVNKGYAIHLNPENVLEEEILNALNQMSEDPKYYKSIFERSDVYKNQEMNPMDKAVYWVEHVIKYKGAKHLKSKGAQLSWYQYMLLDVIALIAAVSFITLLVNFYLIRFIWRKFRGSKKVKTN